MHIHDVLIVGAGPCGLAVAARLRENTPSATFTDDEHQRYHWIRKHGRKPNIKNRKTNKDSLRTPQPQPPSSNSSSPENNSTNNPTKATRNKPEKNTANNALDLLILDASGPDWLTHWTHLFHLFHIPHLRSPLFFHLDPSDRDALLSYVYSHGREDELLPLPGCAGKELSKHKKKKKRKQQGKIGGGRVSQGGPDVDERDRNDYFAPSSSVFEAHWREVVARYGLEAEGGLVRQEEVVDIEFGGVGGLVGGSDGGRRDSFGVVSEEEEEDDTTIDDDDDAKIFKVSTNKGVRFARVVVLAIGAGCGAPSIPPIPGLPAAAPDERNEKRPHMGFCHAMQLDRFPPAHVAAKVARHEHTRILIVGGGLTSVQLADLAIKRGVSHVHLLLRGPLKIKHFDVDLEWVGKFRNLQQAVFWSADTDEERVEMLHSARNGGSIPPHWAKTLYSHIARGTLTLHSHTTLASLPPFNPSIQSFPSATIITTTPNKTPSPTPPTTTTTTTTIHLPPLTHLTFATGPSPPKLPPFLQTLQSTHPIRFLASLPCLTHDLAWSAEVPSLFVTGRLAGLRLGPGAANLVGARVGAERVVWNVGGVVGRGRGKGGERGDDGEGDGGYWEGRGSRFEGLGDGEGGGG